MRTFTELRGQPPPRSHPALFDGDVVTRTFDTPEFRDVTFYEVQSRSILNHVPAASRMPFRWTINVYRGCTHACVYCFARPSHTWLGLDAGRDFETKIVVKVNAPELLRAELRRRSWLGEHVAMGTNTDPYQRCEGRYRLTRAVLEVLRDARNPCSVLTKSPLLLRDVDVMRDLVATASFTANLSIGTVDEEVWRRTEPGTPHPRARVDAVRALTEAGIPCGVLVAPVLPGISDGRAQLEAVVRAVAEAGATYVSGITLHLRNGVKEEFWPWLEHEYPHLVPDYERIYKRAYAPADVQRGVSDTIADVWRRHGKPPRDNRTSPGLASAARSRDATDGRQPPAASPPTQLALETEQS